MAARKQPTLVDAYDVLTRIADSLEKLVEGGTSTNEKVEAPSKTETPAVKEKPLLPVSAPTTSAPTEKPQTAPTTAEPTEEAPTLESLQKTVQIYVRGVEGDPNAPDVETQNKRMNQVQGLLLKIGKRSLKELDEAELKQFAEGLAELIGAGA